MLSSFFLPETLSWWVIPVALAMDALAGDPRRLPHPVRWMGRAIERCEPFFRKTSRFELWSGTMFAVCLITGTLLLSALLVRLAHAVHPAAGSMAQVILIFYCLSARSLAQAAIEISKLLRRNDVDTARRRVAMIVGRDVSAYQGDDIARATVETVAENFVDGVFAPLFFAVLGGAPLAMAYKMVNTLDSMVGYKNMRYRLFGRASALIDDAANFIPARISVVFIALSARLLGKGLGVRSLGTAIREGRQHSSPNAGFPEAAFAGALAVKLGGPNIYHGVSVEKPYIGKGFGPVETHHIHMSCQLMTLAAWSGFIGLWFAGLVLG